VVEVAKLLSAESGGVATDSGDLEVSADFNVGITWHMGPVGAVEICLVEIGLIEIRLITNFLVVAS
jgi:hypothetical protein